jgi:hypothetical protein
MDTKTINRKDGSTAYLVSWKGEKVIGPTPEEARNTIEAFIRFKEAVTQ